MILRDDGMIGAEVGEVRAVTAEAFGTFTLVFFGVGSAVFGLDRVGLVGVALAFGLVLMALVQIIGATSGCHVNPAITVGMLLSRRIGAVRAMGYIAAQLAGAIGAAAVLWLLVTFGGITDQTGVLGANSYGKTANVYGTLAVETIATGTLVLVAIAIVDRGLTRLHGPFAGGTLAMLHLLNLTVTGVSVNPARALGPALFEGGTALEQVWLFLLAPLLGGAIAAVVWPRVRANAAMPLGEGGGADTALST
ncbi:MIP/aquaporin family protein [Salinactinospora qingdaonensis]|uniref:Aquaporin n=1 Tax=Salinactinospora qingdaonensis TaxID=702744 RepID=A0ABP7G2J1_9ACTN